MINYAVRIAGAATLALAALPMVALATAAHAETTVKVADLNLLSAEGVSTYHHRADAAGRKFCLPERTVASRASCRNGVQVELSEKLDAIRNAKFAAQQQSQTFAAR